MDNHLTLLGGKLQLYRRGNSRFWQCSASVGAKQWRATTKQENVNLATKVAQDWYLGLCGKEAAGTLVTEKIVQDAAEKFTREYEVITEGERSPKWVQGHQIRLRLHHQPHKRRQGGRQSARRDLRPAKKMRLDQQELARELVRDGKSISAVARTFNVHPATIYRVIEG